MLEMRGLNIMSNILTLKTINELNEYSFLVPSYQRGYRWTDIEVRDLLNDINEFQPKEIEPNSSNNEKTWYCLQPLVIKKNNTNYEVIDGQQRLTTIFLIRHHLNQDFVESSRVKLFSLKYETRLKTEQFLNDIKEDINVTEETCDNIDFYYIQNTYNTIAKWFEEKKQEKNFDKNAFSSKFNFATKVIWYESFEEDSISIFARINIGKIPLTNAELIKALFLNNANFPKETDNKLKPKQLEISTRWDEIEQKLQNDRFWFFLTKNEMTVNRIEFIFNLMNDSIEKDPYSTFRYFTKKLQKGSTESISGNWAKIEKYYQRFSEWFEERELYHKIGYLLTAESATIKELYSQSSSIGKTLFNNNLDQLIRKGFENIDVDEVHYGDNYIKKTLLLYNILTMLQNDKDNSYFPFDIYKKDNWDVEHIASIKDSIPDNNYRKQWLEDVGQYIDETEESGKKLKTNIATVDIHHNDNFKQLYYDITDHFNEYFQEDDDVDGISNLALLNSATNRAYKNAVFPIKRNTIIEKDKQGIFIPICTKNVFLKYFSSYPPKISFWTSDDREKYEVDLHAILNPFFKKEV